MMIRSTRVAARNAAATERAYTESCVTSTTFIDLAHVIDAALGEAARAPVTEQDLGELGNRDEPDPIVTLGCHFAQSPQVLDQVVVTVQATAPVAERRDQLVGVEVRDEEVETA